MQEKQATPNYNGGGFVGALLAIVVAGLAWAVLTLIAMGNPWLSLVPLGSMVVLSVLGLLALGRFPQKRWRVVGGVLFLVACLDLYLVNIWWDALLSMWMGIPAGSHSIRPIMVSCVLIAIAGAGALLFLQKGRPEGKPSRDAEKSAASPLPNPKEAPLG